MNKKIIGFVGQIASGKGTAAKYFESNYGAATFRFSTMLRDALDRFYLEQSRDNMIKLSEIMRQTFGEDIMAKTMAKDVEKGRAEIIIIEGIRRLADIEYLSKLSNFVLAEIYADPQIRYERLVKRGENVDDTTKTYEQFLADHQRSTELSILEVIKQAKVRINNNGSFADLHRQLDELASDNK